MKTQRLARLAWFVTAAALIATFAILTVFDIRMAMADYWSRLATLRATRDALQLEPDAASYYVRLAALVRESDPQASKEALRRAVVLNPRDSESWIELALRAETSANLAAAERSLLTAARIDKTYLPKWSLANYYFRRDDPGKFWFWAREAIKMAYGDSAPLFSLCWRVTNDGAVIERELDIHNADQQASYLTYLTSQNRAEPMTRAAVRLLAWNRASDVPLLTSVCARLIADDRAGAAMQVWNSLSARHRIPYGILQPEAGQSLTDGDFRMPPTSTGFDWRLPGVPGVTGLLQQHPEGLRLTFSGRQPENCEVLTQYLPVMENSPYELRYRYHTTGIAAGTGLAWRITDLKGTALLALGTSLAAETETEGQLAFKTSAGHQLVYLALVYQRALGSMRIEGSIALRQVKVVSVAVPTVAARPRFP